MPEHNLYGAALSADQLTETLTHLFKTGLDAQKQDNPATPICIWGLHGIGKTMLVEDFAQAHGWEFTSCSPAQFEEMGDLNGLPILDQQNERQVTSFAPPSWVPSQPGPGILLLDDINRADDRILRGIMQLLQRSALFSWQLPKNWQIVATANPEGGDYSVTPMDDAILTRMLHVSLVFDPKSWAKWARNNDVDPRGIAFVLTYPEAVTGRRTTPRSLTQFFEQLKTIPDLKAQERLVYTLASSALDEATVSSFMAFVNDNLQQLIDPAEIVSTADFSTISKRMMDLSQGGVRMDLLSTVCTRLLLHLCHPQFDAPPTCADNLVSFLMLDCLPTDLRVSLHRDLVTEAPTNVRQMLQDPRLATLLLSGM